jgi:replication-associated recombination protein RarA
MQDKHPIAFLNKKLGIRNQRLSVYEKELLALLTTVTKSKNYLISFPFTSRTHQVSLKNLLDKKINTAMQQNGFSKLLCLDYTIVYNTIVFYTTSIISNF